MIFTLFTDSDAMGSAVLPERTYGFVANRYLKCASLRFNSGIFIGRPACQTIVFHNGGGDVRLIARKTSNLDMRESAALPLIFMTAREGLVDYVSADPGNGPA